MSPDRDEEWTGPVADGGAAHTGHDRRVQFAGKVWDVITEDVEFGDAVAARDVVIHPGAVAVIALDEQDRVLLIRQYRHAVGTYLFEPPAGLLDAAGEPAHRTAIRELAEEAGYEALDWSVLVDLYLTPGGSSEAIRIYLARGLAPLSDGRIHTGEAEEAHLPRAWVPLDEARDLALAGAIGSPTAVTGILAAWVSRAGGWASLRPADAPWPVHDRLLATDRVRLPHTKA